MDFIFLKLWLKENACKLAGSHLINIFFSHNMYELKISEGKLDLFLHSGDSVIYYSKSSNKISNNNGFTKVCREHLKNALISDISIFENDKVIKIELDKKDMFGNVKKYRLILELINRYENIILCELSSAENLKILASHKKVGWEDSKYRQIVPGYEYQPPPSLKGPFILDLSHDEFLEIAGSELDLPWSKFIKNFSNMPKFLAEYYIEGDEPINFWNKVSEVKELLQNSPNGIPKIYYNYDKKRFSLFASNNSRRFTDVNSAFKFYYQYKIKDKRKKELKRNILKELEDKRNSLEQKIEYNKRQLEKLEKASLWKKYGELLKSNLHKVKAGYKNIEVVDYYKKGQPKTKIPLNPEWSPQKNMKQYFKKFKKAKSGHDKLKKFIEKSKEDLKIITKKINNIKQSNNIEFLRDKKEEVISKTKNQYKQDEAKKKFRRFFIKTGKTEWNIYVGRGRKENDELTTKFANSEDWFLHSRIYHGSHVIVRNNEKRDNLPRNVLHYAAGIAAYFSKAKHSKKVPVDYTKIKYVRKPSKSPAGFVVYSRQKTIFVSPLDPRQS